MSMEYTHTPYAGDIQHEQARSPIRCELTDKVLAYVKDGKVYFWCKACRVEHGIALITLQDVAVDAMLNRKTED